MIPFDEKAELEYQRGPGPPDPYGYPEPDGYFPGDDHRKQEDEDEAPQLPHRTQP